MLARPICESFRQPESRISEKREGKLEALCLESIFGVHSKISTIAVQYYTFNNLTNTVHT